MAEPQKAMTKCGGCKFAQYVDQSQSEVLCKLYPPVVQLGGWARPILKLTDWCSKGASGNPQPYDA